MSSVNKFSYFFFSRKYIIPEQIFIQSFIIYKHCFVQWDSFLEKVKPTPNLRYSRKTAIHMGKWNRIKFQMIGTHLQRLRVWLFVISFMGPGVWWVKWKMKHRIKGTASWRILDALQKNFFFSSKVLKNFWNIFHSEQWVNMKFYVCFKFTATVKRTEVDETEAEKPGRRHWY